MRTLPYLIVLPRLGQKRLVPHGNIDVLRLPVLVEELVAHVGLLLEEEGDFEVLFSFHWCSLLRPALLCGRC